jgi:tetratricopeptide (TPR) repeat protein
VVVALLFACHPLRTETVAWISTRGDILCAIFLQISLIFHLRHIEDDLRDRGKNASSLFPRNLVAAFLFCLLSFLCRAWAITYPMILLFSDFAFRRPRGKKPLILEKVPFFVLSAIFAVLALSARSGGMPPLSEFGVERRLVLAASSPAFYLWKTLIPASLSPLYPLACLELRSMEMIAMAQISFFVSIVLLFLLPRSRLISLAWFSFVVILLPVSGLSQSGIQFAADRYSYISTIPLFILFAGLLAKFARGRLGASLAAPAVGFALLIFSKMSIGQIAAWRNDLALWTKVLDSGWPCKDAYYNRGCSFLSESVGKEGDARRKILEAAERDFSSALEHSPGDENILLNRGKARMELGMNETALEDFSRILSIVPHHAGAISNRSLAFEKTGRLDMAERDLRILLGILPDANTHLRLASVYRRLGELDKAEKVLNEAAARYPSSAKVFLDRGGTRLMRGDKDGAKADFRRALDLEPGMKEALANLKLAEE